MRISTFFISLIFLCFNSYGQSGTLYNQRTGEAINYKILQNNAYEFPQWLFSINLPKAEMKTNLSLTGELEGTYFVNPTAIIQGKFEMTILEHSQRAENYSRTFRVEAGGGIQFFERFKFRTTTVPVYAGFDTMLHFQFADTERSTFLFSRFGTYFYNSTLDTENIMHSMDYALPVENSDLTLSIFNTIERQAGFYVGIMRINNRNFVVDIEGHSTFTEKLFTLLYFDVLFSPIHSLSPFEYDGMLLDVTTEGGLEFSPWGWRAGINIQTAYDKLAGPGLGLEMGQRPAAKGFGGYFGAMLKVNFTQVP